MNQITCEKVAQLYLLSLRTHPCFHNMLLSTFIPPEPIPYLRQDFVVWYGGFHSAADELTSQQMLYPSLAEVFPLIETEWLRQLADRRLHQEKMSAAVLQFRKGIGAA